jgi:ABC-type nitrate/sulfonate/bicarbonate transport system substrate-binding protein
MRLKLFLILLIFMISLASQTVSYGAEPKINVGIGLTTAAVLPVYVLMDRQFYREEGLEANFPFFRSGTQNMQALISGDIQMGVGSINEVISTHNAGQNPKIFWTICNGMHYQLFARPDIKNIKDLKGKKIGISRYGSLADFVVRYVVKHFDMDPERDVKILQVGDINTRYAALKTAAIDATIIDPPLTTMASKEGFNMIVDVSKLLSEWPYEVFYARGDYLKQNVELVRKFMRSYKKAIEFTKQNPEASVQALLKVVPYGKTEGQEAYNYYFKTFPDDGAIPLSGLKLAIANEFENKRIQQQYPPESMIDTSFIEFFKK